MKKKSIQISDLLLDPENPRYKTAQENETASLIYMMDLQKDKLINLMRSIVSIGLSPIESLAVYPSKEFSKKFIVAEGNRRICALKLLLNPNNAELGPYSDNKISIIKELSIEYNKNPILELDCTIFDSYEEAAPWVQIKHGGEQEGVGLVRWGADEKSRHEERLSGKSFLTTIIKEYFVQKGVITEIEADKIAITSLFRFVNDKKISNFLGFDFIDRKLVFDDDNTIIFDAVVGYISKQFALKKLKVKTIYDQPDRFTYLYTEILPGIQLQYTDSDLEYITAYFEDKLFEVNQLLNLTLTMPEQVLPEITSSNSETSTADGNFESDFSMSEAPKTDTNGNVPTTQDNADGTITQKTSNDDNTANLDEKNDDPHIEEEILERTVKSFSELFQSLKDEINNSKIEDELKQIIKSDLRNALIAFDNSAWKATAIMLGTILEGVMLGTLIRQDTIDFVLANHPTYNSLHKLNLLNPTITDHREKIIKDVNFEIMKAFVHQIIPDSGNFKISDLQELRNILHPMNSLRTGNYKRINQDMILVLLTNCKILVNEILKWNPPV